MSIDLQLSEYSVATDGDSAVPFVPTQLPKPVHPLGLADVHFSAVNPNRDSDTLPSSLIVNWFRLQSSNFSPELLARLHFLAGLRTGWRGTLSQPMSADSLRNFLRFWADFGSGAKEPNLTLMPKGRVKALWHRNPSNLFDAQFCEDGRIIYGIFWRGRIHEGVGTRAEVDALLRAGASTLLKAHEHSRAKKNRT